ncbi:MAG TPA: DUF1302 domain-containing protein [Rudaea sp.]|jgi:hypothetical protein|nr:DUF1302 domain-containing protein [Rudaea sp.]
MTKTTKNTALAVAIALALNASVATRAHAIEFGDAEGFHGTWNTTLSYGIAVRTEDPSSDNVAKAYYDPLVGTLPNPEQRAAKGAFSANHDDGDLNYKAGSPFSNAVKATTEVHVNYGENLGAFVRASYFYDFENSGNDKLTSLAEDQVGHRGRILDAFLFDNFNLANHQASVRVGKQVVSWGESTFIQGGINVINPVDVSQLHVAGAELKEALLPVNMIWGSYNITDAFSVEGMYLLEFAQTNPDPEGTYFSTNDFATIGGTYASLPFGLIPQPVRNPENYYPVCFGGVASDNSAFGGGTVFNNPLLAESCAETVRRTPDQYPSEYGQWGVAAHYVADALNNTEFGFYFLRYSSRLPIISGRALTSTVPNTGSYFVEYPTGIRMFGLSFNTQIEGPGIALQGELSYRPNAPLQIDAVELLFAGLSPLNAFLPAPGTRFVSQLGNYAPGEVIPGYTRNHVSQLQFTGTKVFGPNNPLHADQIAVVGEVGATKVWDLPSQSVLRYNSDGTDTGGGPDVNSGNLNNPETQTDGFPTAFSWGYRLAARADYNNAFGTPFTMSPRIAFNHDVSGTSPGPGGNFIEGRKSVTVGVESNYLNQWAVDLSYTNYFGGGQFNLVSDRDFVAFVVKYSF